MDFTTLGASIRQHLGVSKDSDSSMRDVLGKDNIRRPRPSHGRGGAWGHLWCGPRLWLALLHLTVAMLGHVSSWQSQSLALQRPSMSFCTVSSFRVSRLPFARLQMLEPLLRDSALPWHCRLALALPFAKLQPCFAQPVHSIPRPASLSLGQAGIFVRVSRLPFARLQTLETLLRGLALP